MPQVNMQIKKIAVLTLQVLLPIAGLLFAMNAIELGTRLSSSSYMYADSQNRDIGVLSVSLLLMVLCFVGAAWLRQKRRSSTIKL
jgi:hypothetical protein